jgi:exodeoxyribonuclease V alpha subunit
MGNAESLKGIVERITFFNQETGFTVAKLACRHRAELVCAVGIFPAVQPGESVACEGRWHCHPQHGMQFIVQSARIEAPADVFGIRKYLQSGLIKGIGPVYADRIVSRFQQATLEIIDREPERLLEVPGIGAGRLAKIRECWEQQRSIRDVMVFLQSVGVNPALAQRIYKTYRQESIPKVREDPYRLAREVAGVGFRTADAIAQKMGISPTHPRRLVAGIEYVLSQLSEEGHVCYPREELIPAACAILQGEPSLVEPALDQLLADGRAKQASSNEGKLLIWKKPLWLSEQGIAAELRRLVEAPTQVRSIDAVRAVEWVERALNLTLADKQREAVAAGLISKVLVITGGPGTGKSTITRAILAVLQRLTRRILLAAPTGRAAQRLTEITGRHAQTIHSMLEWDFRAGTFKRGRDLPLACDLLIVDEASMIDTVIAYSLLRAIPSHARTILVGDIHQLPSVGPGNVLRDIIASKAIPVAELTQIFRQARGSQIVVNAHRIHAGLFPFLKSGPRGDFFFVEREDPEELKRTVIDLVSSRLPRRYELRPADQIQVLTPMKRGIVGTLQLNAALQCALNPRGEALCQGGYEFRCGDKVMQTRNDYDKKVFNGEMGRIQRLDLVNHQMIVEFEGREVTYDWLDLDELQLAYAVSVHKSQGGEWPCVVIPIHTTHLMLLDRNLLYTAITRGRRLVVLVGTRKAIAIAIRNQAVSKRHTGLTTALLETMQRPLSACRDPR